MRKSKTIAAIITTLGLVLITSTTALAAPTAPPNTMPATITDSKIIVTPNYVSDDPPVPGDTNIYCLVTASPSLVVRSGPGTSYSSIATVPFGELVYVVEVYTSGWAKIQSGSSYGYVSTAYLDKSWY